MLTKAERSKINKQNRAKGNRVEYDDKVYWLKKGVFALRIPARQQRDDFATFDVVVCKPEGTEIHQCKYHKRLLTQLEKDNHVRMCQHYGVIPVLCWRNFGHGLVFDVLE